MKNLIMILLCLLTMLSCRSRKKVVEMSQHNLTETVKIDTNTVVSEEKKVQQLEKKTEQTDQKEKSTDGDIVIKGKTDSLNREFNYHNVVNGDTLSDIYISGKADFIIKNRWKQTDKKEVKITETDSLNIIAKIARKTVAQSTIKDVAEKITKKKVAVKSTGFTFPMYGIIGAAVLLLVFLWFGWKKFGGEIMERINNLKNKLR